MSPKEPSARFRLEIVKVAVSTMDSDGKISVEEVVRRSETLYRYVTEGVVPTIPELEVKK